MLPEKPWRLESTLRLLLVLLVCLSFGGLLAASVRKLAGGENSTQAKVLSMLVGTLSFQGAAFALIGFFLRGHHIRWEEAFGFKTRAGRAMMFGLLGVMVVLPVGWLLQIYSVHALEFISSAFEQEALKPREQEAVQALRMAETWTYRFLLGVVAIGVAPVAEELLFRGILYPAIKQSGFPRLALWATAILFAVVHLNLATFVPLIFLAIVLTLIYEETNNLLAPILTHSLFNAANFFMLYFVQPQLEKLGL